MTMTTLITSVSETIRNWAPLAEAKTTGILEKQKNMFYGTPVSVPYRNYVLKNCFPTHNFTEIGQSAAEL